MHLKYHRIKKLIFAKEWSDASWQTNYRFQTIIKYELMTYINTFITKTNIFVVVLVVGATTVADVLMWMSRIGSSELLQTPPITQPRPFHLLHSEHSAATGFLLLFPWSLRQFRHNNGHLSFFTFIFSHRKNVFVQPDSALITVYFVFMRLLSHSKCLFFLFFPYVIFLLDSAVLVQYLITNW